MAISFHISNSEGKHRSKRHGITRRERGGEAAHLFCKPFRNEGGAEFALERRQLRKHSSEFEGKVGHFAEVESCVVLIHNGIPICESLIIVQYIDETWPALPRLIPHNPYERALARFWADFIDKQVFIVWREMILSSREVHEKAKEKLKNSLEIVDGTLRILYEEDKDPLFGGKNVNVVDLVLGPIVVSKSAFEAVGEYDLGGAEQLPNLFKWMEAFKASPAAAVLPHADEMKQIYVTVHNDFQASIGQIQARVKDDNGVVKFRCR